MGTRSLTVFKEADFDKKKGKEICVMYRQFDGYPSGHGKELAEFLADMVIVNGLSLGEKRKVANSMACLTAQVIAHFKTEAGGIYVNPGGSRNMWEDYIYTIFDDGEDKPPLISLREMSSKKGKVIFIGTANAFLEALKNNKFT